MMFNCSAEFHGISTNKELLCGLHLKIQLASVLIRFCQEQMAAIGDTESMFYKVCISEEHKSLLTLLWQKDRDFNNPPINHEMGGHVFGGVTSSSCTNYALKKTAHDNKVMYGPEAGDILNKSFYVDEMLKSVVSVPETITVIKNVRVTCRAGGFRLTKFVSHSEALKIEHSCQIIEEHS